jgi:hypothetical protein
MRTIQFGHATCIKTLAELKADVNQANYNSIECMLCLDMCFEEIFHTGGK